MSPITKWLEFSPDDTGYRELRLFFDFLKNIGQIGPKVRGDTTDIDKEKSPAEADGGVEICLVDADDLLDKPEKVTQLYCASVGLSYDPAMLSWDNSENRHKAAAQFERFPGFHDEAIKSSSLKPRQDVSRIFQSASAIGAFPSPLNHCSEVKRGGDENDLDREIKANRFAVSLFRKHIRPKASTNSTRDGLENSAKKAATSLEKT